MAWPSVARFVRGRALPALLIVLVAITISVRLILHYYGVPMEFNHHFTLCRLDAISFGSLAAWWLRSPSYTYLRWRRASVLSLFGGSAGILVAKAIWRTQSSLLSYVFVAAVFAGLLGVAFIFEGRSVAPASAAATLAQVCRENQLWALFVSYFDLSGGRQLLQSPSADHADLADRMVWHRYHEYRRGLWFSQPIVVFLRVTAPSTQAFLPTWLMSKAFTAQRRNCRFHWPWE
jgi:hypothetical protein